MATGHAESTGRNYLHLEGLFRVVSGCSSKRLRSGCPVSNGIFTGQTVASLLQQTALDGLPTVVAMC